jgi:hypothetical protein
MTEPSPSRPVPGPRPGPRPGPQPGDAAGAPESAVGVPDPFADLPERPVAEHVAVFETEHARLERELGTIDQL